MQDPIQLDTVTQPPPPPARPAGSHKGTFGTVMVLGGSPTMIGAPAICAAAALRAGAGLVKIACDQGLLPFVLCIEPSATGVALPGPLDRNLQALDEADPDHKAVLAVGPGLGQSEDVQRLVTAVLHGPRPTVLDADGLNSLARSGQRRRGGDGPLVLTPHPGEFKRLAQPLHIDKDPTDPDQRPAAAARLALAHGAVVVLKGQHTVVTDGKKLYVNHTGNPALATAGSGDVLTGLTASLLAQGMQPLEAAVLAVHAHGKTADRWAEKHGRSGLVARELAELLPDTFHALRGEP